MPRDLQKSKGERKGTVNLSLLRVGELAGLCVEEEEEEVFKRTNK